MPSKLTQWIRPTAHSGFPQREYFRSVCRGFLLTLQPDHRLGLWAACLPFVYLLDLCPAPSPHVEQLFGAPIMACSVGTGGWGLPTAATFQDRGRGNIGAQVGWRPQHATHFPLALLWVSINCPVSRPQAVLLCDLFAVVLGSKKELWVQIGWARGGQFISHSGPNSIHLG